MGWFGKKIFTVEYNEKKKEWTCTCGKKNCEHIQNAKLDYAGKPQEGVKRVK